MYMQARKNSSNVINNNVAHELEELYKLVPIDFWWFDYCYIKDLTASTHNTLEKKSNLYVDISQQEEEAL